MAFSLTQKKIHCPNCNFEGKAKLKGSATGALIFLILFIISFFFWPLFIASFAVLVYLIFRPADQICPKCKFANPIPLKQFKASQT